MADIPKILGQASPAATTLSPLYTVPVGITTVISSVSICNRNSTPISFRISVASAGASDDPKQYLYYDLPVIANDTFIATIGMTVGPTDVVRCYSSDANVAFNLFGIENSSDFSDGWTAAFQTWTYASSTTFTVPGDWTSVFAKGDKIKLTQTTVKYFYVVDVAHSSGTTTVTVAAGSDYSLANEAITNPFYSKAQTPAGFPQWFTFDPAFTGFSTAPAAGNSRFSLSGTTCTIVMGYGSPNGVSNSTSTGCSIPIRARNASGYIVAGPARHMDNGSIPSSPGMWEISSNATTAVFYTDWQSAGWTASGDKRILRATLVYEI